MESISPGGAAAFPRYFPILDVATTDRVVDRCVERQKRNERERERVRYRRGCKIDREIVRSIDEPSGSRDKRCLEGLNLRRNWVEK